MALSAQAGGGSLLVRACALVVLVLWVALGVHLPGVVVKVSLVPVARVLSGSTLQGTHGNWRGGGAAEGQSSAEVFG
jgi:hypothetical protein